MSATQVTATVLAVFLGLAGVACSRNAIEAVNLAIDGDKAKSSNLEDAISKYDQATKIDPDNARIWWKLALAYEKKEDWQKMASACSKAEETAERADRKKVHAITILDRVMLLNSSQKRERVPG